MAARTTTRLAGCCRREMTVLIRLLQTKLLALVKVDVVGQQEQEEASLRKAIDQYSDIHSSIIRKEFVRLLADINLQPAGLTSYPML